MTNLETILVVDDTAAVLTVVVAILKAANFDVLQASSGKMAIRLSADYAGTIHLLLSDVKMPETSGPELGELLKKSRPIGAQLRLGFHQQTVRTAKVSGDGQRRSPHPRQVTRQ